MLLSSRRCSDVLRFCVSCSVFSHSISLYTDFKHNKKRNQNTANLKKDQSTQKPRVTSGYTRSSQRQNLKEPSSDEYYEDAADMKDDYAPYFPESPYEGIDYREQLMKHHIVPDFIPAVPDYPLEVFYRDAVVKYGNMLTPNETKMEPIIMKWHHESNKHYTMIMTDPDGPFGDARDHEEEWHHWLITNIYGHHIAIGDIYAEYIGVIPSRGKHIHRYVFLIYEQPGNETIDFDEIHLGSEPINMLRGYFSTREFVKRYKLIGPRACNFFLADWSLAQYPEPSTDDPYEVIGPNEDTDRECRMGGDVHRSPHHAGSHVYRNFSLKTVFENLEIT